MQSSKLYDTSHWDDLFLGRVYFRCSCKKMFLRHWLCHDQHVHCSAQFRHEILYCLGICTGYFMCMLSWISFLMIKLLFLDI